MYILFREMKNNWYSLAALLSTIYSRHLDVEARPVKFEEIKKFPPEKTIVAYSFMSFDLDTVREEVKTLKERGYTLIAGGPHVTADPEGCLRMGFDHVFTGDGEENILRFLMGERKKIFDGISKRVNLNHYSPFLPSKGIYMPIEITRGCPFSCAYCQTPIIAGRQVRHRDVDVVVHYAKLGVKHGRKLARFIAPNSFGYGSKNGVTPNVEKIEELLYGLKRVGIEEIYFGTFPSEVRPESVTDEVLKVVKKYVNNRSIVIGAQSGSDRILKIIKRGHTVEQVEEAIEKITLHGFIPHVDFIFGFPFETEEDVEKTFSFIVKIVERYGAKIHAHTFMPLPGTELFNAGPGRLTEVHYKFLGRLASKGILDGYWMKQEMLARKVYEIASGGSTDVTSDR
jgi:B12-binding domain/radical SAM domain protein